MRIRQVMTAVSDWDVDPEDFPTAEEALEAAQHDASIYRRRPHEFLSDTSPTVTVTFALVEEG